MPWRFLNRRDAGVELAAKLRAHAHARDDVLVLALPRGGVPVGYEVAQALGAGFDVLIVRKLGVPKHPELAMGAIASGGARYLNDEVLRHAGIDAATLLAVELRERRELDRRERLYRGTRPASPVRGKTVILVDDGIATGASMHVAAAAVRSLAPARLVVAVPVAPAEATQWFVGVADDFVCVHSPRHFQAVGDLYREFGQVTDNEVRELLGHAHPPRP